MKFIVSLIVNVILFVAIAYLLTLLLPFFGYSNKSNEIDMSGKGTYCYSIVIDLDSEKLAKYK